jgi:hypothetical protein
VEVALNILLTLMAVVTEGLAVFVGVALVAAHPPLVVAMPTWAVLLPAMALGAWLVREVWR